MCVSVSTAGSLAAYDLGATASAAQGRPITPEPRVEADSS